MNLQMINTLVAKDLKLYFRNRFFALITVLALVFYVIIFFILPNNVEEILEIGIVADAIPAAFAELEDIGLALIPAPDDEALQAAMDDGEYNVGVSLSADFGQQLLAGDKPEMTVFYTPEFPEDLRAAYNIIFEELAFNMAGQPLTVDAEETVLGIDMAGQQVAFRWQILPLLVVAILMMETLGLASLISSEVEAGTLPALLITPLRVEGVFTAKTVVGVLLAFVQVTLLMGLTGGLSNEPLLVLTTLLLGSLMVTGLGFLLASVSRDMMSVLAWGILLIVILSIPAITIMLPNLISPWVRLIPSYYLVDTINQVVNFGAGWSDVAQNLLILLGISLAFLAVGVLALRRKFR
jgi:ABC-2 type transport system permease protein